MNAFLGERPYIYNDINILEAKQARPSLADGIYNERAQKQSHSNANSHLDHRITDVESDGVEPAVCSSGQGRSIDDLGAIRSVASDLVRGGDARDQTSLILEVSGRSRRNQTLCSRYDALHLGLDGEGELEIWDAYRYSQPTRHLHEDRRQHGGCCKAIPNSSALSYVYRFIVSRGTLF